MRDWPPAVMNRSHLNTETNKVFDSIGSFFVQVFYNNHFEYAKSCAQSGTRSLTEEYCDVIRKFMAGISHRNDLCMTVASQLHNYYNQLYGGPVLLFVEFQDRIMQHFIPPEYYRDFSNQNKDSALRRVLIYASVELGNAIIEPSMLRRVIDQHGDKTSYEILQDRMIDALTNLREEYYSKFVKQISASASSVPASFAEKLKQAYIEEKREKCKLKDDTERLLNMTRQLVITIQGMKHDLVAAQTERNALIAENAKLRAQPVRFSDIDIKLDAPIVRQVPEPPLQPASVRAEQMSVPRAESRAESPEPHDNPSDLGFSLLDDVDIDAHQQQRVMDVVDPLAAKPPAEPRQRRPRRDIVFDDLGGM